MARIAGTVQVARGMAQHLPFSDRVFDGVLCMNALHHVLDLPVAPHHHHALTGRASPREFDP